MEQHHYWDSFFQSVPGKHKHLRWWRGELMFMSSPEDVFLERAATSSESAAHFEKTLTAISSQPFLRAKSFVRCSCQVQTERYEVWGWLIWSGQVAVTLYVNLYRSRNISWSAFTWAATSGSRVWMARRVSAFRARQPVRNSALVNRHICSAPNCQAKTGREIFRSSQHLVLDFFSPNTLNSSGLSWRSIQNSSIPSDSMLSSWPSLYFS